jgi:hypothetical protein
VVSWSTLPRSMCSFLLNRRKHRVHARLVAVDVVMKEHCGQVRRTGSVSSRRGCSGMVSRRSDSVCAESGDVMSADVVGDEVEDVRDMAVLGCAFALRGGECRFGFGVKRRCWCGITVVC